MENLIKQLADYQINAQHNPRDVLASYNAFTAYNTRKFANIPVTVHFSRSDAYKTSGAMFQAIESGHLTVYSEANLLPCHPFTIADNMIFRAVHDYFGHYQNKLSFSTKSELRLAAILGKELPEAIDAILCETVLQTCVYHVTGNYAEQKALRISDDALKLWGKLKREIN